jgi:hypothetical protein
MGLKDFAAFGGLILGLINLFLYIYKEFFRKGKLQILENKLTIKPAPTNFDFQLDLRLRAKNENITINEIFLENDKAFSGYDDIRSIELKIPIDYKKISINNLSSQMTQEQVMELIKNNNSRITDMKIDKGSNKSFTFIDRVSNVRFSDGFEDTPKKGWKIKIKYDKTELILPLDCQYLEI